ncbi:NAD(P)-dependent alcohol dehydrogenase [Limibacter armeniacum]|uniref:NAD(P)-dependent alcohol dehydrogenase n=1 Tax=Limibacter armeniacum TaxID=466084 RepID=UPI002FE63550
MAQETTPKVIRAYAAQEQGATPAPWQYEPRQPRPDDVSIEILYCGVCHSDIHFVDNDWNMTVYPVVPGHEIVGRVKAVGSEVSKYKVGDMVGVGCLVDSCRQCSSCNEGLEQYCAQGVWTYNGVDRFDGKMTYGGYSEHIIVSERFVVHLPDGLDPAAAAPILCAGITTYSPLKYVGVKPGDKVGVVGMGGLGHMGIKFAKAMGAEVTLFTRSESKIEEGRRNGADHFVISTVEDQMNQAAGSLDYILDTVPVEHDLNPYVACLKVNGTYILVGQLTPLNPPIEAIQLVLGRRSILGSAIGGMPETQEVLDFCAEHGISCDVEMLDIHKIGEAYERMKRGDVRYRFVIDMESLKNS